MSDPLSAPIFLSSTLRDLKYEREAVEKIIHRLGDFFVGMEHFGATPSTPVKQCLAQVERAEIFVLIVGFRHGSVPRNKKRSMVEREFWHAKQRKIPILAYLGSEEVYSPKDGLGQNPRIIAFREYLLENHTVSFFSSPKDLAAQIAADVGREIRRYNSRLERDAQGERLNKHEVVVQAIREGALEAANRLNVQLLDEDWFSPRAHYNQCCILSRMAAQALDPYVRRRYVQKARSRLYDAIQYGILNFMAIYNDRSRPENADIAERIIGDPDLVELFTYYPLLKHEVRDGCIVIPRCTGC